MSNEQKNYATGRRKESVARVWIQAGSGKITVNGRAFDEYFPVESRRTDVQRPLVVAEKTSELDIMATVKGGGVTGQSGAMRHAIARALVEMDEELRAPLRKAGFLTRDARAVERKKYGQPGARKNFQFSKR